MLIDAVADAVREVGAAEVVPRFRALRTGDITEKSPGDVVTVADEACERVLGERLRQLRDLPVVGEEASAADPSLLELVDGASAVWLLDPIDGTSNFVAGHPDYGIMVALVEAGETRAAWIWLPATDQMFTAARGGGTCRNGIAVRADARSGRPRGLVKRKYMDEPERTQLAELSRELSSGVAWLNSAAVEYTALIDGRIDCLFYWRTLPWDHAPAGLIAAEAGCTVARPDGAPYRPGDGRTGLLATAPGMWDHVASRIEQARSA